MLVQRAMDAQVRQAARTAAGQHQAHRGAALDACQPCQVALQRGPNVQVAADRAPVEPGPRAARTGQFCGLQQHQDLGRLGMRGARDQALLLGRVQRRWPSGIGQQQQLVAVAAAKLRPRRGAGVAEQQHKLVAGLDLVKQHGNAPAERCALGADQAAVGGAGLAERGIDRRRIEHADAADATQFNRKAAAKVDRIDAVADRQQPHRHRPRERVALVLGLQAPDDLAREGQRELRAAGQQLIEMLLVQPHQHRVTDRHHGGRAGLVGVEAHLADDLAAPHLTHHVLAAIVVAHVGAQPPADREVHRVAGLTLLHQRLATGHLDPLEVLPQQRHRGRLHVTEQGLQVLRQQRVLVRLSGTKARVNHHGVSLTVRRYCARTPYVFRGRERSR